MIVITIYFKFLWIPSGNFSYCDKQNDGSKTLGCKVYLDPDPRTRFESFSNCRCKCKCTSIFLFLYVYLVDYGIPMHASRGNSMRLTHLSYIWEVFGLGTQIEVSH